MSAAAGVRGRTISLKLKRRKTGAPDPPKFMGHGDCDNMSRSVTLSRFTDAASELGSQGKALLRALRIDPTQIRGIGLNVSSFALFLHLGCSLRYPCITVLTKNMHVVWCCASGTLCRVQSSTKFVRVFPVPDNLLSSPVTF